MENEDSVLKEKKLIDQLKLEDYDAHKKYEKCEIIAGMATPQVIEHIEDTEIKEGVKWLKEAHSDVPPLKKWRKAFANLIQSLIQERGGSEKVEKWHELEQICGDISEEDLNEMDEKYQKTIREVWGIHGQLKEWRVEVIEEINEESRKQ